MKYYTKQDDFFIEKEPEITVVFPGDFTKTQIELGQRISKLPGVDDKTFWAMHRSALRSKHMRNLRVSLYEEQHGKCKICWRPFEMRELQAHHFHYFTLGNEDRNDVALLCGTCHAKGHGKFVSEDMRKVLDHLAKSANDPIY